MTTVAVDEGEGVRNGEADEGEIVDDVEDTGRDDTAELGVREASVVEGTLVREAGMVDCAVTGPGPRVTAGMEWSSTLDHLVRSSNNCHPHNPLHHCR